MGVSLLHWEYKTMHHETMQHMIAVLEEELRAAGYSYSADFLKIAASSLKTEAALSISGESPLDRMPILQ